MNKRAFVILDLVVDETVGGASERIYPYGESLAAVGFEPIFFFGNGSKFLPDNKFKAYEIMHLEGLIKNLSPHFSIAYNWHRKFDFMDILVENNVPIIARGDSDGRCSIRYHPIDYMEKMWFSQPTLNLKIRAFFYWLRQWLFKRRDLDQSLIANLGICHVTTLGSQGCVDEFRKFVINLGKNKMAKKVQWLPYPVRSIFLQDKLQEIQKTNSVICVGRWTPNDWGQKNPDLLIKTLPIVARCQKNYVFTIYGPGALSTFGYHFDKIPNIKIHERVPGEILVSAMGKAKILIIPSRWEGSPIVANEMLLFGGSVVGTPIPSLKGMLDITLDGQVSKTFAKSDFYFAIHDEIQKWEKKERCPYLIKSKWNDILNYPRHGQRILDLIGLDIAKNNKS